MSSIATPPRPREKPMQTARPSSLMEGIDDGYSSKPSASKSGPKGMFANMDGRAIAMLIGGVVILGVSGFLIMRGVGGMSDNAGIASRERAAVDGETGKVFPKYRIKDGETWPWKHPSTGARTLYPAESCYWTKDGQAKLEPTYVLLNKLKGVDGPTICPDCGREVVAHNPMPPTDLLVKAGESKKSGSN